VTDPRIQLLEQLRASTYDVGEHKDVFTYGWNRGTANALQLAIVTLFTLPVPTYSCRFPVDPVVRGLRELAGVVQVDFSDVGDA
jgi:hypothetical protein